MWIPSFYYSEEIPFYNLTIYNTHVKYIRKTITSAPLTVTVSLSMLSSQKRFKKSFNLDYSWWIAIISRTVLKFLGKLWTFTSRQWWWLMRSNNILNLPPSNKKWKSVEWGSNSFSQTAWLKYTQFLLNNSGVSTNFAFFNN